MLRRLQFSAERSGLATSALVSGLTVAIAVAYFLAARLGLLLLTKPEDVAVFWPASGIAAGILIAFGPSLRKPVATAVVAATVAANLLGDRNLWSGLSFGICNAAETLLVAWLLQRWFGRPFQFDSLDRALRFLLAAAIGATLPAFGAALAIRLFHNNAPVLDTWRAWALSDALGVVAIAPALIELAAAARKPPRLRELIEGLLAVGVIAALTAYVFTRPSESWLAFEPIAVLFPILLWIAARCQPVFAAVAVLIVAFGLVAATTFEIGSFGDIRTPLSERVLAAQAAMLITSFCALVLTALFTERRRHEAKLAAREARLRLTLDAAQMGTFEVDAATGTVGLDGVSARLLGFEPETRRVAIADVYDRVHPDDRRHKLTLIAESEARGKPYQVEFRLRLPDGSTRWLASRAHSEIGPQMSKRTVGVNFDITARKQAEEHAQLLLREVNHRAKNLLAVVQVVARWTADDDRSRRFARRFSARLAGLAASHDLLVKSDWRGVELTDLMHSQLAHFRNLIGSRIIIGGPAVRLSPGAAQTIGMALHELATNAGKYGALSTSSGAVEVSWDVIRRGSVEFQMQWLERGGPPVTPPKHRGFGHAVLVNMVELGLNADVGLEHFSSGVTWRISAPASSVLDGPTRLSGAA